jgi:hypothetical protein
MKRNANGAIGKGHVSAAVLAALLLCWLVTKTFAVGDFSAQSDSHNNIGLNAVPSLQGSAGDEPDELRAQEVIARYKAAAGGAERLSSIRSLVAEGTYTRSTPRGVHEAPFIFRHVHPSSFQIVEHSPHPELSGFVLTLRDNRTAWALRNPLAPAKGEDVSRILRSVGEFALGVIPTAFLDAGLVQLTRGEANEKAGAIDVELTDGARRLCLLGISSENYLPVRLIARREV